MPLKRPALCSNRIVREALAIATELYVAPSTASVVIMVGVVVIINGVLYQDTAVVATNSPAATYVAYPAILVVKVELVVVLVLTALRRMMAGFGAVLMDLFAMVEQTFI
ncbi:hypothetical protein APHAL10511_002896 [Amanita phalloides]|nr:hypothetical protein APHAL10511_002896 [Amanita phalloides]